MGQDETGTWVSWLPASALHPLGGFVQCSQRLNALCVCPWDSHGAKGADYWPYCPRIMTMPELQLQGTFVGIRGKGFIAPQSSHHWKQGIMRNSLNSIKRLWVMTGNRGTHLMICFLKSPFLESHCVGNQPQWRQQALSLTCSESQGEASWWQSNCDWLHMTSQFMEHTLLYLICSLDTKLCVFEPGST